MNNKNINNNFHFFYIIFTFILIFFIIIYILLKLNINIQLLNILFSEKNADVQFKILYLEGNEVYYTLKNKKPELFKYNSKINKNITLETGKDSFLCFYIKDQGTFYLYPESLIYINKLENYNDEKSLKETEISLEKGKLYLNVNLLYNNSNLVITTDNLHSLVNKGKFIIDNTDFFNTKITCFEGKSLIRANSNKFDFYQEKKIYNISNSIERMINSLNILEKNHYAYVNNDAKNNLDNLLIKYYETKNLNFIKTDYLKNQLQIKTFENETDNTPPNINEYSYLESGGYIEFYTQINNMFSFNNKNLNNKTRYIFYLKPDIYNIVQDVDNVQLIHSVKLKEDNYKNIIFKEKGLINSILINNKNMEVTSITKDDQIYIFGIKNISLYTTMKIILKSGLIIKKTFILSRFNEYNNFIKYGKTIKIGGEVYNFFMNDFDTKNSFTITNKIKETIYIGIEFSDNIITY